MYKSIVTITNGERNNTVLIIILTTCLQQTFLSSRAGSESQKESIRNQDSDPTFSGIEQTHVWDKQQSCVVRKRVDSLSQLFKVNHWVGFIGPGFWIFFTCEILKGEMIKILLLTWTRVNRYSSKNAQVQRKQEKSISASLLYPPEVDYFSI